MQLRFQIKPIQKTTTTILQKNKTQFTRTIKILNINELEEIIN